jgi:hypothetical protein
MNPIQIAMTSTTISILVYYLSGQARRYRREAQQLRVQLASCSIAALDGSAFTEAVSGSYSWSPAYADVLSLRHRHDAVSDIMREVLALLLDRRYEGKHTKCQAGPRHRRDADFTDTRCKACVRADLYLGDSHAAIRLAQMETEPEGVDIFVDDVRDAMIHHNDEDGGLKRTRRKPKHKK